MLTRRNVLKRFASTVAAGGMALVGLRPAKASPVFRPAKSGVPPQFSVEWVEGKVTVIGYQYRPGVRYFGFGRPYRACVIAEVEHVTIIRNRCKTARPVKDVKIGDTICVPKYLTREIPM